MTSLPIDEFFDAVADVQRRRLLVRLMDHNPQDPREVTSEPWEMTEEEREHVKMEHVHLPKLVDYGFVEWHRDENEVVKGPRFGEIRPLLELIDENSTEMPTGWV